MKFATDTKQIATETVRCLIAEHNDLTGPVKYRENGYRNPVINQLSRATVRLNRPCYIWRVNRYNKEKEAIASEYRKGMVFNYGGCFVTKERDADLLRLIEEREAAPYTGTAADLVRVNAIHNRLAEIGGVTLHWE